MTISTYLISHLLYNSKTTLKQALVDEWGRIDYLIETDVREAENILVDDTSNAFGDCTAATVASPKISLKTAYSSDPIIYYNSTVGSRTDIRRCGPIVLPSGELSGTVSRDSLVAQNANLGAVLQADTSLLRYTVNFSGLGIQEIGFTRLRARAY